MVRKKIHKKSIKIINSNELDGNDTNSYQSIVKDKEVQDVFEGIEEFEDIIDELFEKTKIKKELVHPEFDKFIEEYDDDIEQYFDKPESTKLVISKPFKNNFIVVGQKTASEAISNPLEFITKDKTSAKKGLSGNIENNAWNVLGSVDESDDLINAIFESQGANMHKYKAPEGYLEIERYFVDEPYAFVCILYNDEIDEYRYYIVEPDLNDEEIFFLGEINNRLKSVLLFTTIDANVSKEDIIKNKIEDVVERYHIELEPTSLRKIIYYIIRDSINFGNIDVPMRDKFIEDISCDGYDLPIFVYHWKYGSIESNISISDRVLDSFVIKLAQNSGKQLSLSTPMADLTLEDGSRGQVTLGEEVTAKGSTFTIRRFKDSLISPIDLIHWGTFSVEAMAYIWLCVWHGKSILFVGGTASGKTTSLNAIALFILGTSKIITIEDTREIKLPHKNWIPSVSRESFTDDEKGAITMYDLLKAALRQRPEYIILGEVRGDEAITLFQAMSTGHTVYSTSHADSVDSMIHRLEYPPMGVPRSMMQALDVFAIQSQVSIKGIKTRKNLEITENQGIDPITKNIRTNKLFNWDPITDEFSGINSYLSSKVLSDIAKSNSWDEAQLKKEMEERIKLLELMTKELATPHEFITTIRAYKVNPDKVRASYGI